MPHLLPVVLVVLVTMLPLYQSQHQLKLGIILLHMRQQTHQIQLNTIMYGCRPIYRMQYLHKIITHIKVVPVVLQLQIQVT